MTAMFMCTCQEFFVVLWFGRTARTRKYRLYHIFNNSFSLKAMHMRQCDALLSLGYSASADCTYVSRKLGAKAAEAYTADSGNRKALYCVYFGLYRTVLFHNGTRRHWHNKLYHCIFCLTVFTLDIFLYTNRLIFIGNSWFLWLGWKCWLNFYCTYLIR